MPSFQDLRLIEPILRALAARSYTTPTPIQQQSIPPLLLGRDLLGIAQTGTGKTAAFALPILQRLSQNPVRPEPRSTRVLVLSPTRELASQIADSFTAYGQHLGIKNTVIFGGVGQHPQVQSVRNGIDIIVATPGRLLDLINQRHISLRTVEVFVLDEADRMLDMGFLPDVERVIRHLPQKRHSMLFSATMPPNIQKLARSLLIDPIRVEVTPPSTTAEKVEQFVYFVRDKKQKDELLRAVLEKPEIERVLVFTRTKHGADKVVKHLKKHGEEAMAIHGNKSQSAREKALDSFRDGRMRVLVATDIAARGIDVPSITHVINFDLPNVSEQYVHRIGRTARAGRSGTSLSFCAPDEREFLRDIEKLIRQRITVVGDHPVASTPQHVPAAAAQPPAPQQHAQRPQQGHGHRGPRPQHGGRGGQGGPRQGQGPRPHQHRDSQPQRPQPRYDEAPFGFLPEPQSPQYAPRNDGPRQDGPSNGGPRQDPPRTPRPQYSGRGPGGYSQGGGRGPGGHGGGGGGGSGGRRRHRGR
jgi:ATP-dependent RNA helicase RhlE